MSTSPECVSTFFWTWKSTLVSHLGLQSMSNRVETPCRIFLHTLVCQIDVQVEINVQVGKFFKDIKCAGHIRHTGGKNFWKINKRAGGKISVLLHLSILGYITCPKKALILYFNGSTIASEFFLSFLPAFLST